MQENPDQEASSSQGAPSDLRTSRGEVVRRADLERAAGTPARFVRGDPRVAGYEGVELARAALAGDRAALDEFHERAGLALPGVTEHGEGGVVRLVLSEDVRGEPVRQREARAVFQATNEGGNNSTCVDAAQLVAWVVSPEGRAALARRGITVPILATEGSAPVGSPGPGGEPADHEIDPVTYADQVQVVRVIRRWLDEEPSKSRWTLTRSQIQGLLSVIDALSEDEP